MADTVSRWDGTTAGSVAWLDVSAEDSNGDTGRTRTGPLGLQIAACPASRAPYFFRGARLRGARCVWSATTVSGALLTRAARAAAAGQADGSIHVLARVDCAGTVFDPVGPSSNGLLRIIDTVEAVTEQFLGNSHLFTLSVPQAAIGLEPGMLAEMFEQEFELTAFQVQLLRSGVTALLSGTDELTTSAGVVGVDRYLAAFAGLLLRSYRRRDSDPLQLESIRARTDTIIYEQAADPTLTPASIAVQLNVSLRQLYRAFDGAESPAARIRRRRLDRAAELLSARSGQPRVERVARDCGFASAEYFSRAFRREFGLSPRAYRSAHGR